MADTRADTMAIFEARLARQMPALADRAVVGFDAAAIARSAAAAHARPAPLFRGWSPAWVLLMLALLLAAAAGAVAVGFGLLRRPVPTTPIVYHHNGEITLLTRSRSVYTVNPTTGAHRWLDVGQNLATAVDWSPDGSRLTIVGYGGLSIYDPATGTNTALSVLVPDSSSVSWSPDGRRVAYAQSDGIHLVDIASGKDAPVPGTAGLQLPPFYARTAWSPDGREVLYVDAVGQLYAARVDGSGARHVGTVAGNPWDVTWSPDSSKIAYLLDPYQNPRSTTGDPYVLQLWVANADGSHPTKLFERPGCCVAAFPVGPIFSPDGKKIALYVFELWLVDSRSGGARNLGSIPPGSQGLAVGPGWLAWRPVP